MIRIAGALGQLDGLLDWEDLPPARHEAVIERWPCPNTWVVPATTRVPRWIQLNEPIYNIASPRFALAAAEHGKLRVVLTPNDLGTVDFEQACLEPTAGGVVLHRPEGDMPFERVRD